MLHKYNFIRFLKWHWRYNYPHFPRSGLTSSPKSSELRACQSQDLNPALPGPKPAMFPPCYPALYPPYPSNSSHSLNAESWVRPEAVEQLCGGWDSGHRSGQGWRSTRVHPNLPLLGSFPALTTHGTVWSRGPPVLIFTSLLLPLPSRKRKASRFDFPAW